jgi:hypothetical protein
LTPSKKVAKALASVPILTIRRWERGIRRWMDTYRSGMETQ